MIFKITVVVAVVYLLLRGAMKTYVNGLSDGDKIRLSFGWNHYRQSEQWAFAIIGLLRILMYLLLGIDTIYFVFTRF